MPANTEDTDYIQIGMPGPVSLYTFYISPDLPGSSLDELTDHGH
ncbi:MAG: hypothetical protein SV375_10805 [Thermodesulfobacteriota bacterium]|nr:hypothetical protein [Thermodesulfobacteriota bacterium]